MNGTKDVHFRCKCDPWNCSFAQTILLKTEEPEHLKKQPAATMSQIVAAMRSSWLFCFVESRAEKPVFAKVTTLPHKFVLFFPPNLDHFLFC
jgi:hypothetical protein